MSKATLALTDQIVVVTGASSGIGKAITLQLAREGAQICLVGRNSEKLEAVARCARQFSEGISTYKTDLGIDDDIHHLAANLQKDYGAIDILIHSAGVIFLGRMEHASIEHFDRQYRINVRAAYLLTQALLPMIKPSAGQVVFINSSAGLTAKANVGQYAATKHALKAIADSLREEVNADGVRVTTIYPGRTASPMQALLYEYEKRVYLPEELMQPEDVAMVVANALGLPRTAEVTDISIRPLCKR
jgi:NADP-dependent 3-hydroxy acid dehydrogenase YdfG